MSKKELYDEESAAAGGEPPETKMYAVKCRPGVLDEMEKKKYSLGVENFSRNFASNVGFFEGVLPFLPFPGIVGAAAGSGIALRVGRLVRETREELLTRGLTSVRAKDLWQVSWPIMKMKEGETNQRDEKCKEVAGKITIVLDKPGFRAIQKIIGNSASFTRHPRNGRIYVGKPHKAAGVMANALFKAGVAAAFPERASELEDLEVEHKRNSALGVSKAQKDLNQARYGFKTISFYTQSLNKALNSQSEALTSGVSLNRLQAKYTLNWIKKTVRHPLKCLAKFRKDGKATSPLKTLKEVHAERVHRIYEHHFSESQMNKYRPSLMFVKSPEHEWRLQKMTDDEIKAVIRKRYRMPTATEIAEQRKEFKRLVPIQREERNKREREQYKKKKGQKKAEKKAKKAKKGQSSIREHFKPS